jgi:hypothetical protein
VKVKMNSKLRQARLARLRPAVIFNVIPTLENRERHFPANWF